MTRKGFFKSITALCVAAAVAPSMVLTEGQIITEEISKEEYIKLLQKLSRELNEATERVSFLGESVLPGETSFVGIPIIWVPRWDIDL